MAAEGPGNCVVEIVAAVYLDERKRVGANREAVEEHSFNAGLSGVTLNNTLAASLNALFGKRHAHAAFRLADRVIEPGDPEPGFVDRFGPEGTGIVEHQSLVRSEGNSIIGESIAGQRRTS